MSIPVGWLAIVVEDPKRCIPPSISGRIGQVAAVLPGQSLMAKCNIRFPDDARLYVVWKWSALRPISPPPGREVTERERETT